MSDIRLQSYAAALGTAHGIRMRLSEFRPHLNFNNRTRQQSLSPEEAEYTRAQGNALGSNGMTLARARVLGSSACLFLPHKA